MYKLNAKVHIYLTESILKSLAQNRILTILDFLQEDVEKLSKVTKLNLPQIIEVRSNIFHNYSAPLISGTALLNKRINCKNLTTGIAGFDKVLSGIPIGFITEICGLAGSGKSQFCMQFAINCVKDSDNVVLYIDTKGDFSAVRIQKILDLCGYSHKDMAIIMLKIRVVHVWCMEDLVDLLTSLKNGSLRIENLCLIIIDSLPCLLFQHFGDDNKIGLSKLNSVVNNCRYLNKELEISIVCVNILTRWIDIDVSDLEEEDSAVTEIKDNTYIEKHNRCLGKYWAQIPYLIIYLEKDQSSSQNIDSCDIRVTIKQFNNPGNISNCIININPRGVC